MKRIRLLALCLVCICLLCACGNRKQVSGRVLSFEDGVLTVQTEKGKSYDFLIEPLKTPIFDLVSGEEEEDLDSNCMVQITWERKQGQRAAQHIWIHARLHRNVMQLSDGTSIDVWDRNGWREYCLEDGTPLLVEDNPGSLDHHSRWNELLYGENFPEEAQQGILSYYEAMGLRYDIPALLENAYLVYGFSEEFDNIYVSQFSSVEGWNADIICCKTHMTLPQRNSNGGAESFYEGAVFDRETGEHLSNYDLFTLTLEELETYLLDQLDRDGTLNRESIHLNLKPEQIVLCQDGGIEFYLVDMVEQGVPGTLQIGLSSDQAKEILQPWAVMDVENNS